MQLQLGLLFFEAGCFNASLHFTLDAHFSPVNITAMFVAVTGDDAASPSSCKGYFSVIIPQIY